MDKKEKKQDNNFSRLHFSEKRNNNFFYADYQVQTIKNLIIVHKTKSLEQT